MQWTDIDLERRTTLMRVLPPFPPSRGSTSAQITCEDLARLGLWRSGDCCATCHDPELDNRQLLSLPNGQEVFFCCKVAAWLISGVKTRSVKRIHLPGK